jgi:hypothetical protein
VLPHPRTWAKKFLWRTSWHNRWLQATRGFVLHRIAVVVRRERYFYVGVDGETVCGLKGRFYMPGVCSRTGAPRCKRCCQALGIPAGNGAPYNATDEPWKNA